MHAPIPEEVLGGTSYTIRKPMRRITKVYPIDRRSNINRLSCELISQQAQPLTQRVALRLTSALGAQLIQPDGLASGSRSPLQQLLYIPPVLQGHTFHRLVPYAECCHLRYEPPEPSLDKDL